MSDYEIKKRDNRPVWQLTLKKGPTGRGKPFDLRDATVRLYIEHENGNGLVVEGEEVDVKRGMLGEVEYEFDQEQTLYGGNHPAEFEIEWDDGGTATVPNRGYYNVRINTPLNRDLSAAELEPGDYTVGYLHANAVDTRELTVGNDGPYTSLAGPGLTRENGRLAVTAEFSGIEGMSNPATAHVDFDNYDAQNVGELDSQSVRTDELTGTVHFLGPDVPVSEINSKLQNINNGDTLFLRNGDYTVDETLEIPNNRTITANRRQARLVVDDETVLTAYDDTVGGGGLSVKAVVRNASVDNCESVRIHNLHVDFTTSTTDDSTFTWAGIWLNGADPESTITGCHAENVMPDIDSSSARAYGIYWTGCMVANGFDVRGDNCGYEGVGARGENEDIRLEKVRAFDNGTHACQISGVTGGDAGRPDTGYIKDFHGNGRLIIHGFHGENAPEDGDSKMLVEDATFDDPRMWSQTVRIHDYGYGVVARNCDNATVTVENDNFTQSNTLLENVGYDTSSYRVENDDGAPIAVMMRGTGTTLEGLTLRNCSAVAPQLLHIEGRDPDHTIKGLKLENCYNRKSSRSDEAYMITLNDDGGSAPVNIEDMTILDSVADTDYFMDTSGGTIDSLRMKRCDMSQVAEGVFTDDSKITEQSVVSTDAHGPFGDDDWREIARFNFSGTSFSESVDTPEYVDQGAGAIRVKVHWDEPASEADIRLVAPGQSTGTHEHLEMDDTGAITNSSGNDAWTLAGAQPSGLNGGSAYAVISCPRQRPICQRAGGVARGLDGTFMVKGTADDTTSFSIVTIESDQSFANIEIVVEATPKSVV